MELGVIEPQVEETFDTYEKRSVFYKVMSLIVSGAFIFIFSCIFFPDAISKAPQPLMVFIFLLALCSVLGAMFIGGSSIKTYQTNGHLTLTDSYISINQNMYFLKDLSCVETMAGKYKGLGTRGGLEDGTGNKIIITTKDHIIIKAKFVVASKDQRNNLTHILKDWKAKGHKIISNGIDLV